MTLNSKRMIKKRQRIVSAFLNNSFNIDVRYCDLSPVGDILDTCEKWKDSQDFKQGWRGEMPIMVVETLWE